MPESGADFADSSEAGTRAERYTAFYREHYQRAVAWARFKTTDCDYEALVADAFLLAWQRLVDTDELEAGWFYRVLRNKIGEFYRFTRYRGVAADLDPDDLWADVDLIEQAGSRVDIRRVLRSLPAAQRESLMLAYWCELTGSEAAGVLGSRQGTFRVRLHRAQRAFLTEFHRRSAGRPTEELRVWTALRD